MTDLSVIIVNWNAGDVLPDCINSLYLTINVPFEIILVDNNSSDNSVSMLKELFPGVLLISEKENLGFARACNKGFLRSTGKYILFLNPDTVVSDGAISKMTEFLTDHPEVGIVGPKIIEKNGGISFECKRGLPTIYQDFLKMFLIRRMVDRLKFYLGAILPSRKTANTFYEKTEECECLSGSCMLMRRSLFELLNGFDESVSMYLDDNDICKRSNDAGFKNFYVAEAEIIHIGRYSTGKSEDYKMYDVLSIEAHLFYYKKHFGLLKAVLFKFLILLSVPYLLTIDIVCFPYFIMRKRVKEYSLTVKKHLKYLELVFRNRIGFM